MHQMQGSGSGGGGAMRQCALIREQCIRSLFSLFSSGPALLLGVIDRAEGNTAKQSSFGGTNNKPEKKLV
jgi:hypothetical protein